MSARVGVIADTHAPEFVDGLPPRVFEALAGVDLILHAGDVSAQATLDALERIAPVVAVRGDHDRALPALPRVRELMIDGMRVVVVHGEQARWIEEPETLLWTLSLGHHLPHRRLPEVLRRRFPDAHVIVFGHTHRASATMVEGALVFNPGGVHQWNPETARRRLGDKVGWFEWCWLQVARHLRVVHPPSVGLLEFEAGRVLPRVVEL